MIATPCAQSLEIKVVGNLQGSAQFAASRVDNLQQKKQIIQGSCTAF